MDSLRQSFKSYGSLSFSSFDQEEQPILLEDPPDDGDRREVVVKIDSTSRDVLDRQPSIPVTNSNNVMIWREPSYEFWKENGAGSRRGSQDGGGGGFSFSNQRRRPQPWPMTEIAEDPSSRRISSFLRKQRFSGNDVDLELEELMKPSPNGSKELHVSFQNTPSEPHSSRDSYRSPSSFDGDKQHDPRRPKVSPSHAGEVLRCTSNASLTVPSTLHSKTRSRLIDPPPPATAAGDGNKKSSQFSSSGPIKSGILGKAQASSSEGDEDPFVDEDIPNEFKRAKFDLLTILQWVSLIPLVAALACSLSIPALKRQTVWGLHLWKWELLFYVLICGRLVSGWFIRIVVFFIERNFTLRKRVLYFVYGVRKAMQNCLWLGLVLLSWHYMLGKKAARETKSKTLPYVTKVLFCVLMACAFRLVKILLIKVLASSFHVSTYFDRIQESLFNQYVIETLSGPPMVELQSAQDEEQLMMAEVQRLQNEGVTIPSDLRAAALPTKRGRVIGNGKRIRLSDPLSRKDGSWQQEEEGITIDHLRKLNQKNVSAWDMKRLMRIVRDGALMTLDEQAAQERGMDEAATEIRSEHEAKAAAKKIFINTAKPGAK